MSTETWRIGIGLIVFANGIILSTRYLKLGAFFSFIISRTNDSYSWVVSPFGGLPGQDAFRGDAMLILLQGIMVLITAILLHFILCWS